MPGVRTIIYVDHARVSKRELAIRSRPKSWWRLVPGLSPLVLFRLGALASFRLDFRLISSDDTVDDNEQGGVNLELRIGDNVKRTISVRFPYPQKGRNTHVNVEDFYFDGLGSSELRLGLYSGTSSQSNWF